MPRLDYALSSKLNSFPGAKRAIKRVYQRLCYAVSRKEPCIGNIRRVSPKDTEHDYFFGYYDKCPWDATGRYMLCLKADDTWSDPSPRTVAEILLIDTSRDDNDPEYARTIARTSAWNVQQGCMLQWLGPDNRSNVIYNDFRNGKLVSVILDVFSGAERVIDLPVYSVSSDGKTALSLDFSRLYNLRPGYGYYNVPESTEGISLPDSTAVWRVDLEKNETTPILTYRDFAEFKPRAEMDHPQANHKVNHIMINPSGTRFMILHRWFNGGKKYTRLITCDLNGQDKCLLLDDDMVSHCCWQDDNTILAFARKTGEGLGYYMIADGQNSVKKWLPSEMDGHPSFSPDKTSVVTDTYANGKRMCSLMIVKDGASREIARVFEPFKYDNDTRCDLHPRWNREGTEICFDGSFEGRRGLYIVKAEG